MTPKTKITAQDILPLDQYTQRRKELLAQTRQHKAPRRIQVGPYITFYFESFETMRAQVQEMLYIEKGGDAQLADELAAYNPLIPQGQELVATVMVEIENPTVRKDTLAALGGFEHTTVLSIGDTKIKGRAEDDLDRTTAEGKASSVQFIHFDLSKDQIKAFMSPDAPLSIGITHPNYGHIAMLSDVMRHALSQDFIL